MAQADVQVEEEPKDNFYEEAPAEDMPADEVPTHDESTGEVNPDDIPF
jgi:hypothetical protein